MLTANIQWFYIYFYTRYFNFIPVYKNTDTIYFQSSFSLTIVTFIFGMNGQKSFENIIKSKKFKKDFKDSEEFFNYFE